MPGADPNPITTHLGDDEHHLTRADLDEALAEMAAQLRRELAEAIAALPMGKAPTKK